MTADVDQFRGALLGLALGDAMGAPHEGGPLERLVWRFMGTTSNGLRRFTDDTQMSLDLAESLVERGELDADDVARQFGAGYRWSRGYGPGAATVLKRIRAGRPWREANRSVYPAGSFGNGAAMRAPVIGLFFSRQRRRLSQAARQSAEVTHAHPLAVEGATLVATATATALGRGGGVEILEAAAATAANEQFIRRISAARSWLASATLPSPQDVRVQLGMGITATDSCITGIYLAARFLDEPLGSLLGFVATCGGDVDTVGAMAGAIWGARNGYAGLPANDLARLEDAARIDALATALHSRSMSPANPDGIGEKRQPPRVGSSLREARGVCVGLD